MSIRPSRRVTDRGRQIHHHPTRRPPAGGPARRRGLALAAGAAGAVVAAAVAVPGPVGTAHAAVTACQVDYLVQNEWPGGFTGNITITNLGEPVDGWQLAWTFTAGQQIRHGWNGDYSQQGSEVTVDDVGWNAPLGTGASTSIGFNASWDSSNPPPGSFTLDGVACTGEEPTTPPTTTPPTTTPPTTTPPTTTPPTTSPPPTTPPPGDARQLEDLDRGVISVRSGDGNLVSWRWLGTDPDDVGFHVYRGSTRVNQSPVTGSTNLFDAGAPADASYTVRAVVDGQEQSASAPALRFGPGGYLDVPIQSPGSRYRANDASVGDLDGDGRYEIVLKWDPDNSRDNSQAGFTDEVYVDAYELSGQRLWRINLGRNIRAGAHYTQFQVYDYDGDGEAEVAMKTADGTVSGTGQVIGDGSADHRNGEGYVLSGPEFLTVFDGRTGGVLDTVDYVPGRGNVCDWGDCYGNRVDRFLAATAYLDGQRPSLIMARGYYTRSVIAAWDFRNGDLALRWVFDSDEAGGQWAGQGNHNISVADVDSDGRDEIVYGAMVVDDDGDGLWVSGHNHGDALHVGDFVPDRPGLEIWNIHESGSVGADLYSGTGQELWTRPNAGGEGPGRGVAGDIYAGSPGAEFWSSDGGLFDTNGNTVGRMPSSANFLIWWDDDPTRELLDGTRIDGYGTGGDTRLLTGSGVAANNGTKSNPALSADLFGDWREEVIWRTDNSDALRIYASPYRTDLRITTLMHDPQYRVAVAWQNTAYNQPPHPGFHIGSGMAAPPRPAVYTP